MKRAENVHNELNSDVVRFTFRESNLSWNKQDCFKLRKVVGCKKVESTSTFWQQNLYMLRALLVQENFAKGDVIPVYGVTFRL